MKCLKCGFWTNGTRSYCRNCDAALPRGIQAAKNRYKKFKEVAGK